MSNQSQASTRIAQTFTSVSQKKAYQPPQVKPLGSVQQLTLKLGSISDGMSPHQQ